MNTKAKFKKTKYIKATKKDGTCRGVLFEVGKEYTTPSYGTRRAKSLCSSDVFHFVDDFNCLPTYYPCNSNATTRYFEIEPLGEFLKDGGKCGSDKIKIVRELSKEEVDYLRRETLVFRMEELNTLLDIVISDIKDMDDTLKKNDDISKVTKEYVEHIYDNINNLSNYLLSTFDSQILNERPTPYSIAINDLTHSGIDFIKLKEAITSES